MGTEIERKYLLRDDGWRAGGSPRRGAGVISGKLYRQGYLSAAVERNVRVRIIGDQGFLTVKGRASGITRLAQSASSGPRELRPFHWKWRSLL